MGFPGGAVVKNLPTSARNTGDTGLIPGSGRSLEEGMATTPIFLSGVSHGQRSLDSTHKTTGQKRGGSRKKTDKWPVRNAQQLRDLEEALSKG